MDNEKYNELRAKAEEELKKAVPYMEKAREYVDKDGDPKSYLSTLETLKTLYYRLQEEEKHQEVVKLLEEYDQDKVQAGE